MHMPPKAHMNLGIYLHLPSIYVMYKEIYGNLIELPKCLLEKNTKALVNFIPDSIYVERVSSSAFSHVQRKYVFVENL